MVEVVITILPWLVLNFINKTYISDLLNIADDISSGEKIFEVEFPDQKPHEHFVGHDVHLVRLGAEADHDGLNKWMNWSDPAAFMSTAPEGVEFMGGTQEMPEGKKANFKANIQPG